MKALKRNKSYFILFILIVTTIINSTSMNQSIHQKPRSAGSTPPSFSNFSPDETNDITPDVTIQVIDSESGLNVDSGYFAFATNGSEPTNFSNPYRDDFNDNKIGDFWSFRNQDNGSFVESGTNITITDLNGDHTWGGNSRNAPFMYQTISGDVTAQVKVSATLLEGWDIAGLLICDELDNFFLYQYTFVPFGAGSYNIALWSSISGIGSRIAVYTVGLVDDLWMRIIRSGDEFAGFYSLDGTNFNLLGFSDVPLTHLTQVGMFVGDNTNATFDDWEITPWIECTGTNTTTSTETMTVHEVPFNHYSEDENKIKFKINDMNDNIAISNTYTVNITEIKSPVIFSDFQPYQTDVDNPAAHISIQDETNGIDKYTAQYAFSINGREPTAFMNPYSDEFNDGNLQKSWELQNPSNGILIEDTTGLTFTDSGDHIWNSTIHDAPYITQNIAGSFEVNVKMNIINLNENKSAGIIVYLDEMNALKLIIKNESDQVNISFYYMNGISDSLINEVIPSQSSPIWLRIIREGDNWIGQYSIDGDTYAVYYDVGSIKITSWDGAFDQSDYYPIPGAVAKVGIIVEHGASIMFQDWFPSPEIVVTGSDGSTAKEMISVSSVRFDEFSEINNKIRFCINSSNNERSLSPIFTVNCTSIYEFRDHTLLADGSTLKIIDGTGNTIWSWSTPISAADLEMLPNGNILAVDYGGATSANAVIKEINITTSDVVWNLSIVGGRPLNFTHDVDYLGYDENGHETFLIADTSNNRAIECYRNGTIKWGWNAADHFIYGQSPDGDPLLEGGWDWTHLNDADRLPDGSTMISLRNFDMVIIVNTSGNIIWEYGEYGNYTLCHHQHNPEFTPQGTILIADSENHRIIEVNKTTKEIIWEYAPTSTEDEYLGWPRDADILPNGNLLICDTAQMSNGNNRIWEIDMNTKEVVWYYDTLGANYDADRLDTLFPIINIKSPSNITYIGSISITITLENQDPWYDEMYYRIYDNTDKNWLTSGNITYTGPTQVFLKHLHSYTLHTWAKDIVMEGGAHPTSRAIVQRDYDVVKFKINLSSQYDPSKPFPGNTLISPNLREVSPEGDVLWSYHEEGKITWDAERLSNGNYLFSICDDVLINPTAPLVNNIVEMTPTYEVVWNYTITGPETHNHEVHDVDKLSNGNYLIADMSQDRVIEVNSTYDIVWEWRSIDHLSHPEPIPDDWVHLNDVDRLPNGNTLITLRNYDTVIEVNPAGDIVWQYGDLLYVNPLLPAQNHSKLFGPHNADRLKNGNTLIADSMNHRCIEIDPIGKIVWEVNQSQIDLLWPRDCDKLPNGNVLIADSWRNRIIEINSTYDIVWEYDISGWTYDADRIDSTPPTILVHSIAQEDILDNYITVNISSPDLDTDTIWYGILNKSSSNWVDLSPQGGTADYQIYETDPDIWFLEDGEYILCVWANDTGYPALGGDQHINTREVQINFNVGYGLNIIKPISNQIFNNITFEFEIILRILGTLNCTWYTLDEGLHNYFFTGLTGTIDQLVWDSMPEGNVIIRFYANNSLGGEILNMLTVIKDTIPPATNISFNPYSGSNKVLNSTYFTLIADDGLGTGVAKIKYKIDDDEWVDYVQPFNLSNYTLGNHIISYYAVDKANNTESIKNVSINIVNVKYKGIDPIIIFAIVISITSIAAISVVTLYILRKRLIARREFRQEIE